MAGEGVVLGGTLVASVRKAIQLMASAGRGQGVFDIGVSLDDADFARLIDELLPDTQPDWNDPSDAKAYALRTGHVRVTTCNGMTLVRRMSGGTHG